MLITSWSSASAGNYFSLYDITFMRWYYTNVRYNVQNYKGKWLNRFILVTKFLTYVFNIVFVFHSYTKRIRHLTHGLVSSRIMSSAPRTTFRSCRIHAICYYIIIIETDIVIVCNFICILHRFCASSRVKPAGKSFAWEFPIPWTCWMRSIHTEAVQSS